jgi:asparagine synthase (glutamine-hydrolysing)
MCGIAGVAGRCEAGAVEKIATQLGRRGPDDAGVVTRPGVALAHRRLSIIDLETGHQPMSNEEETLWIVFNGEIYNYRALRSELERAGRRFRTKSDTEVILRLYKEHPEDFASRLRGIFAFAIWDETRETLTLGVDQVGVKPLYYTDCGGRLAFSSELKGLLALPWVEREVSPEALQAYLAYLYVPAPLTAFSGLSKMLPGTLLEWSRDRGVSIRRYWSLREPAARISDFREGVALVRDKLQETVRAQMVADVDVGVLLSGGIDSSIVAALMAAQSSGRVKSFTVGFGEAASGWSELEHARVVARELGTKHYELQIEPSVVDVLPQVVWHFDEPFGNSTSVLAYLLSKFVSQEVKVCLSGTGGDEAFFGYPRHLGFRLGRALDRVPGPIRRGVLSPLIRSLPESTAGNTAIHRFAKRARRLVDAEGLTDDAKYASWLTYFDSEDRAGLCREPWLDEAPEATAGYVLDPFRSSAGPSAEARMFACDVATFLPYNQLTYMDRMSMAHSLEARVPFCDPGLLALSASIEPSVKLAGGRLKALLKEACKGLVPDAVLGRGKIGFDAPVGLWIKNELADLLPEWLSEGNLDRTGVFRYEAVQALLTDHQSGRRDFSLHLWAILFFEVWHAMYIKLGMTKAPECSLRELLEEVQ